MSRLWGMMGLLMGLSSAVFATSTPDSESERPLEGQFVEIPGGCFTMGFDTIIRPNITSLSDRMGIEIYVNEDETPQHRVCIGSFEMAKHPVTEAQWHRMMGGTPPAHPDWPARNIDWHQAMAFGQKLTEIANDHYQYRLPTEAEWQYACTAGQTAPERIDPIDLENSARYWRSTPTDVGQYPSNPLGLYDMLGNVWEWTSNDYLPFSEAQHWVYQPNPDPSVQKVFRGGSFRSNPDFVSCARRGHGWSDEALQTVGFRLVRTRR